jgi:hypothetical protein
VHLHATDGDVRHPRRRFVDAINCVDADAELVLVRAGRDVFVRSGVDIRVHAERDWRADVSRSGDAIDLLQLGFAFDVEGEDALRERVIDFVAGFTDTRKGATRRLAASLEHAKKLTAGDDVEARALLRKQAQDRSV